MNLAEAKALARELFLEVCPSRLPVNDITVIEKIETIRWKNLTNCLRGLENFANILSDGKSVNEKFAQEEIKRHLYWAKLEIVKNFA